MDTGMEMKEKYLDMSLIISSNGQPPLMTVQGFADKISLLLENIGSEDSFFIDEMELERNFDIIIEENENLLIIFLESKVSKQRIFLNDLLKGSGYQIIPSQNDGCFKDIGIIGVDLNNLDKPSFILTLLHEIGHAFQKNAVYENDPDILLSSYWSSYNERNAWAYALVQARKLEKLGFNVLQSFGGVSNIIQFIDWSLATYDECLILDILDVCGETQEAIMDIIKVLQQRPLFNKKTKNIYQIHLGDEE